MQTLLGRLAAGDSLSREEMAAAVDSIMRGEVSDEQVALLLTGLRNKGETVEEVAGAAESMRRHMTRIQTSRQGLIDTCGTGGDNSGTFNISTAAALVTAAAGVPVAKHGNRKVTSNTGSADVLQRLGVEHAAAVPGADDLDEVTRVAITEATHLHRVVRRWAFVSALLPCCTRRCATWPRFAASWAFPPSLTCWGRSPILQGRSINWWA